MATITTPTPPTTPAARRMRPSPLPPRQGSMTFQVQRLAQPLELEQVVRDPSWDSFKTAMVFLGGVAILAWLTYGSFQVGVNTAPKPAVAPPVVYQQVLPPAPAPTPPSGELTAEEREKRFKEYLHQQDR